MVLPPVEQQFLQPSARLAQRAQFPPPLVGAAVAARLPYAGPSRPAENYRGLETHAY